MRVLLWHVHGSWTTSFVQGGHDYLLPVTPDRDVDGLGRARTWAWPERVREVAMTDLADCEIDVVVLQRPHELELAERWLGRRPGPDVPAVYVEHNTPLHGEPDVPDTRHPLAGQDDILIAHVTGEPSIICHALRSARGPTSTVASCGAFTGVAATPSPGATIRGCGRLPSWTRHLPFGCIGVSS